MLLCRQLCRAESGRNSFFSFREWGRVFLGKEKEAEYTGTLEITNKTGKIVTSSVLSGFSIGESIQPDTQKKEQTGSQIIKITGNEDIPEDAIRALIQKMLTLPDEDTEFLRKDIPDEIWKLLTNH